MVEMERESSRDVIEVKIQPTYHWIQPNPLIALFPMAEHLTVFILIVIGNKSLWQNMPYHYNNVKHFRWSDNDRNKLFAGASKAREIS
jgi:hypothetical protein